MKIKDLVAVVEQAAQLSMGERSRLLERLSAILAKLPKGETVAKALKKRA